MEDFVIQLYTMFHENMHSQTGNVNLNDIYNTCFRNALSHRKRGTISYEKCENVPSKTDIIKVYDQLVNTHRLQPSFIFESMIRAKAVHSNSGILPISIALSGEVFSCAYNCSFCPNECVSEGAKHNIARSYLSSEGTFIRGKIHNFNTIEQVWRRLIEVEIMGHIPDKLEIIALGGTWDCYPQEYRIQFGQDLFYACNTYPLISPKYKGVFSYLIQSWLQTNPFANGSGLPDIVLKYISEYRHKKSLYDEKNINTKSSSCRIIGIVLETRPDQINVTSLIEKRQLGCTRIQLGIQHTDNDVLKINNRGHNIEASRRAIQYAKDAGFKVDGHVMPDLPGTTLEKDYEMVKEIFLGTELQLDYCKLYPCLDLPFTQIRKWKHSGMWKPIAENNFKQFLDFMCYTVSIVPPWTRINRIQRDFPEATIKNEYLGYVSDTIKTNLQQIITNEMKKRNMPCIDIRSREIKHQSLKLEDAQVYIRIYRSNHGTEFFLSVEIPKTSNSEFDDTYLLGLCRLRIPDWEFTKSPDNGKRQMYYMLPTFKTYIHRIARIRELHVYGSLTSGHDKGNSQHRGIGTFLVKLAESIAYGYGCSRMTIISGVGVRDYYERLGYNLGQEKDEYMIKTLTDKIDIIPLFNKTYDTNIINYYLHKTKISETYIQMKYHLPFWYNKKSQDITKYTYTHIQNGEAQGLRFGNLHHKKYEISSKALIIFVILFYIFVEIKNIIY